MNKKIEYAFIDSRDKEVFSLLLRTYKEINFNELAKVFVNSNKLFESCLKLRCKWNTEGYYENLSYWGNDLGIDPNVYLLFMARLTNSWKNMEPNTFFKNFVQRFFDYLNNNRLEETLLTTYHSELFDALNKIKLFYAKHLIYSTVDKIDIIFQKMNVFIDCNEESGKIYYQRKIC